MSEDEVARVGRVVQRVVAAELRSDVDRIDGHTARLDERLARLEAVGERIGRLEALVERLADSGARRAVLDTEASVSAIEVRKTAEIAAIRDRRDARKARRAMGVAIVAAIAGLATALASRC